MEKIRSSGLLCMALLLLISKHLYGGYGWIVCFAAFVNSVIVDGVVFSFGILMLELQGHFKDVSKAKLASVGSVLNGTYHLVGPIVAVLINRFGCRSVCIAGSVISTIAFCMSTLSPNVEVLLFTYGVVGGFGFGLLSMPGLIMVGYYFKKRRATATGIAVCGSSIGTLAFAPFSNYLIDMYGWKGAELIIAGIVLQGIVSGALLRPLEPHSSTITKSEAPKKDKKYVSTTLNLSPYKYRTTNGNIDSFKSVAIDKSLKNISQFKAEYITNDTLELNSNLSSNFKSWNGDLRNFECLNNGVPELLSYQQMETAERMSDTNITVENKLLNKNSITMHAMSYKSTEVLDETSQVEGHTSIECLKELKDTIENNDEELLDNEVDIVKQLSPENNELVEKIVVKNDKAEEENELENDHGSKVNDTHKSKERPTRRINPSNLVKLLCLLGNAMKKQLLMFNLLKYPPFLIYVVSCFILNIGLLLPIFFIPDFAVKQGLTSKQASLIISAVGIANVISRLVCGFLSDLKWFNRLLFNNVTLIIAGVVTVMCPLYQTFEALIIYAAVFGFSIAVFVSLRTIIIIDLLGVDRLTNAFGILTFFQGISGIIGGPIAGALYDGSGYYNYTFYLAGATIAIAGAMNLPLKRLANHLDKKQNMHNANRVNHE